MGPGPLSPPRDGCGPPKLNIIKTRSNELDIGYWILDIVEQMRMMVFDKAG